MANMAIQVKVSQTNRMFGTSKMTDLISTILYAGIG